MMSLSVKEALDNIDLDFVDETLARYKPLANGLSDRQILIFAGATLDDSSDEHLKKAFAACVGKTDEEIVQIAEEWTSDEKNA